MARAWTWAQVKICGRLYARQNRRNYNSVNNETADLNSLYKDNFLRTIRKKWPTSPMKQNTPQVANQGK
jgi:hypothetical protein